MKIPKLLQLISDNQDRKGYFRAEQNGDDATIYVYDVIGGWFGGIDAGEFAKTLAGLDVKNIALRVNSPGGDVFEARAMMTAIAQHPANVTAYIDGLAASAATSLIMPANKIVMTRGARMMIHNAWTVSIGDAATMRAQADILDGIDKEIVQDYAGRTGKPGTELAAMMAKETWFSADEAKDAKFVDEIVETTKKASNTWNLAAFKNTPKDLLEPPKADWREARAAMERRLSLLERTAA